MATWNLGGAVNNTSYYCGPWGASASNYWYTSGYGMPTTRTALGGNQPIYIADISAGYTSGPLSDVTIVYYGVETSGGTLFGSSGSSAELRLKFTGGGTLYVGRNTGNGFTATCARSGGSFAGGVVGTVSYGQVATAPQALSVTQGTGSGQINVNFSGPLSNGDLTITSYTIQYATSSGGPWTTYGSTTSGTNVITLPSGSYWVRVYANNAAGASVAATSASAVPTGGGGMRFNGTSFVDLSIAKRYTGTAFVDLVTRSRYDGANWVTINN